MGKLHMPVTMTIGYEFQIWFKIETVVCHGIFGKKIVYITGIRFLNPRQIEFCNLCFQKRFFFNRLESGLGIIISRL